MATLCNGKITVNSIPDEGSTFTVELPVELTYFVNYRIISELREGESESEEENSDETHADIQLDVSKTIELESSSKPTILIIEDNQDLRYFINDILSPTCNIEEAENGVEGLERAFSLIPDIIICDIRMPGKDGIEVTRTLKSDTRTCHIPVIMLTALGTLENKVKGLETGADDYITKPFNPEILLLKIKNRIIIREKAKDFFIRSIEQKLNPNISIVNLHPNDVIVNSRDEKFLLHALEIVEKHISDDNFRVKQFSSAIAMEASTLYKKMVALTNMSPGDFIRDIRMKRAAQLLKQNEIPISEIAYMVGFENPNYFSKVFKKYYKISPSDYISKHLKPTKEG
jgi:YesN/AraC family two-component response regulator